MRKSWILMTAVIALLQTAVVLAEDDKAAQVDGGDIRELIDQLDSEVFSDREAAVLRLTKLGRPAIGALTFASVRK